MIIKFFKHGRNDPHASIDYFLGRKRDREGARVLQGDPDLSLSLAESLDFKNKYSAGCLSFAEQNIPDEHKIRIMEDFEKTIFAGMQRDQYNIVWIEHLDKNRLELNFFIPRVELHTGKNLTPYYDRSDRHLIDCWKKIINYDYKLADPDDPARKQLVKSTYNLPKTKSELKGSITQYLTQEIEQGLVTNHEEIIDSLKHLGLEIARITDKAISVKDPDGGRNIRLKGEIYEKHFRFDAENPPDTTGASRAYRATNEQRMDFIRASYLQCLERKSRQNSQQYNRARTRNISKANTNSQATLDLDRGVARHGLSPNGVHNRHMGGVKTKTSRANSGALCNQNRAPILSSFTVNEYPSGEKWRHNSDPAPIWTSGKNSFNTTKRQILGEYVTAAVAKFVEGIRRLHHQVGKCLQDVGKSKQQLEDTEFQITAISRSIECRKPSIARCIEQINKKKQLTRQKRNEIQANDTLQKPSLQVKTQCAKPIFDNSFQQTELKPKQTPTKSQKLVKKVDDLEFEP